MSKFTKVLNLDEAVMVDTASSPILYIGKAAPLTLTSQAGWKILKLDTTSGLITKYAGTANYDQIWDNRTSLTYL